MFLSGSIVTLLIPIKQDLCFQDDPFTFILEVKDSFGETRSMVALLKTGRLRLFGQTFQFLDKTKDDDDDDGIFSPFFNKQDITLLTCDSSNILK